MGFLEAVRSSESGIFFIESEGTPTIRVPMDSRETALFICQINVHTLNPCSLNKTISGSMKLY